MNVPKEIFLQQNWIMIANGTRNPQQRGRCAGINFLLQRKASKWQEFKTEHCGKKHLFGLLLIHLCSSYSSSFIFQCVSMATQWEQPGRTDRATSVTCHSTEFNPYSLKRTSHRKLYVISGQNAGLAYFLKRRATVKKATAFHDSSA